MSAAWREAVWRRLEEPWDVLVVGGGITGAGVLHEVAQRGGRALLVEQGDFASGTSSRSSKLVHGGLRYLAEGALRLTYQSVRERDRLLEELPGLVEPIGFLLGSYRGDRIGRRTMNAGLRLYDLFGSGVRHRLLSAADLLMLAPRLNLDRLTGGFWYRDARTDDARLVLRVLAAARAAGAEALSRARVEELVLVDGQVRGAVLRDLETGRVARLAARTVVNATGAWADRLRARVGGTPVIRPLRGSHLLFPAWRFPVAQAVALRHPQDGRPLFAYPWEGQTLLGTTDVDHRHSLDEEPTLGADEAAYLMDAARAAFPGLGLQLGDAISSYAGVRPVVGTGKKDPSKESREHVIWDERGLLTVTGGKLTTFRRIAREAVKAVAVHVPTLRPASKQAGRFLTDPRLPSAPGLDAAGVARLAGRYGAEAGEVVRAAQPGELERLPGTPYLWAELRWAARAERVVHLEDLLLRRVRAGLLLAEGGAEHLPRVRAVCQAELGWDDARWETEAERYLDAWRRHHGVSVSGPAARPSAPRPARPPRREA